MRWLVRTLALSVFFGLGITAGCSCEDPPPPPGCTSDTECRTGERCTMEGTCVVGAECVKDEECTAQDPRKTCNLMTLVCDFRDGFADECDNTRPCPFGQFCTELLGRCLDASASKDCVRRSQCPSGQLCDREANKCVPDPGCYGDEFCEDGEVCDLANRVCRAFAVECTSCLLDETSCPSGTLCYSDSTFECLASADDQTCLEGEQCDALGRCVQCTQQSECGPGLYCNVSTGRCESNVQCVDDVSQCPIGGSFQCVTCTEPQTCDPRTRKCQSPPVPCDDSLDCQAGELCDDSVDPPVCVRRQADCLNDLLDEPTNDSAAEARILDSNAGPLYDALKICQGDRDWYRLDVRAGTYLTIDARFTHDVGDLEMQLFLADGRTLLDESRSTTDNERVELEVGTDITLLLRVFLAVPTIREVPYKLIVARDPGDLCADDGNEPDDSRAAAKVLEPDFAYEGRICTGDPDWFLLRGVAEATRIHLGLDFVDSLGDLDLELYRAGSATPILSARGMMNDERLTYDSSFGGDYWVRVVAKGGDANVYTLRAGLESGVASACLDDPFEPNQSPLTATATVPPLGSQLTVCSGDEDWLAFTLLPGEGLTAEIGFNPGTDLDLALYSGETTQPNVTPLALSARLDTREYLARRSVFGEDLFLRVYGHDQGQTSPYQLDLKIVPPLVCLPDEMDQVGRGQTLADPWTFVTPAPVAFDNGTICGTDEDWFQVLLQGPFLNLLSLHYIGADGQLDYSIHDFAGTSLFSTVGQPAGDQRVVGINVEGVGLAVLFVRVFSGTGQQGAYDLNVDLVPLFDCAPDIGEFNNLREQASLVASSSVGPILIKNLTLCAAEGGQTAVGDEDWYVINPPAAGARMEAEIESIQGDLSLELFSPNGGPRACLNIGPNRCYSDGLDLTERVSFTATVAAPYFLKVSSLYSSPNVQLKPPDANTPYELRIDFTGP